MNTTSPNDDMHSDFFEVGKYNNFSNSKLSGIFSNRHPISRIIERSILKKKYGLTESEFNYEYEKFLADFDSKGSIKSFKEYLEKQSQQIEQEDIVNEENVLGVQPPKEETVNISDVDFDEKKKELPLLWIGAGVLVLVAITVLIYKKK